MLLFVFGSNLVWRLVCFTSNQKIDGQVNYPAGGHLIYQKRKIAVVGIYWTPSCICFRHKKSKPLTVNSPCSSLLLNTVTLYNSWENKFLCWCFVKRQPLTASPLKRSHIQKKYIRTKNKIWVNGIQYFIKSKA